MEFSFTIEEKKEMLEHLGYKVYSRSYDRTTGAKWNEQTAPVTHWYAAKGAATFHLDAAFNMELKEYISNSLKGHVQ